MSRIITVAAAQLGPIQKAESRSSAVDRMVRLMERAHKRGVELVVFPELALAGSMARAQPTRVLMRVRIAANSAGVTRPLRCARRACQSRLLT